MNPGTRRKKCRVDGGGVRLRQIHGQMIHLLGTGKNPGESSLDNNSRDQRSRPMPRNIHGGGEAGQEFHPGGINKRLSGGGGVRRRGGHSRKAVHEVRHTKGRPRKALPGKSEA